ncbi:MAG: pitrilysin family protein [Candidatus Zixiibacteriota bacterium]
MKTKMIRLLVAGLVLATVAAAASVAQDVSKLKYPALNPLVVPKVEKVTLENGIRLYFLEDKSLPIFRAAVMVNGGSYLEPPEKIGLADICGSVMRTGGTAKWSGDQIDEMLESVGGSVETNIGLLSGRASVNVLSDYTDLGLEVLADILRHPAFNQDKIELAKVERRSMISRRNDDPMTIGRREFAKAIYGPKSVYARHTEYTTINGITRDDLVAFHKLIYNPENLQLAVWGDYDRTKVLDKIKQLFGDWQKGASALPPPPKVDYAFENHVYFVNKSDINQSNVFVGHIGGLIDDPDYASRIVMNNVLGGSFGSRLFNSVRSREGLAYAVFGTYSANFAFPGIFFNFASTKSETTVKAAREIIKEIKRMQTDAPTADETSVAKDGYLNSFVFNFDDKADVINRLMTYDFYGKPEDFLFKEKEAVEKVTSADVLAAAQKNLHPTTLNILVIGNGAEFGTPLDSLGMGKIDTIDITIPKAEEKKQLSITPENLKKGKELLDKAVAAHGGLTGFKKVKAVAVKGTFTIATPQGDFPLAMEALTVYPDKSRQVATMMGQKMYDIRDGGIGWKSGAMGKLTEKTADDLKEDDQETARNTVYIFMTSDKPKYQAVYDGSGEANGSKVEFVTLIDVSSAPICRLALDAKSLQLVAKSYWGKSPFGEGTIEDLYSDFKTVNGLTLPMSTASSLDGKKFGTMQAVEFTVNPEIPAGSFEKPL